MRLSLDIPDNLAEALERAARDAGYRSVSEWTRQTLAHAVGIEIPKLTWGRQKKVVGVQGLAQLKPKVEVKQFTRKLPKIESAEDDSELKYEDIE